MNGSSVLVGDAREALARLPKDSVQCCITSPPYWGLRDYGMDGQIGLEGSPSAYVAALMPVFDQIWRVLRDHGTLWLNLGDTYIGYHGNARVHDSPSPSDKPGYRENMRKSSVGADGLRNKNLAGIPWRVAMALQDRGWILRADIIWHKPNSMPERVKDRPMRSHEYIFLFSKSQCYYYDIRATVDVMGIPNEYHNKRSVWVVPTRPFAKGHHATFPSELIRPCVLAGCPAKSYVLDPFCGSGTVGQVCVEEGRGFIGIEINQEYADMAERRIAETRPHGPRQASLFGTAGGI